MSRTLKAFEDQLREAIQGEAFSPGLHPNFFITGSQVLANRVSANVAVLVLPHGYLDPQGVTRFKRGARWTVHISDLHLWTTEAKQLMTKLIADEVNAYVEQGTLKDENVSLDSDVYGPVRLRRAGDRTIN